MEIKQAVPEHVMDLFKVVKCSTPVYKGRYMYNVKGIKYKCESPDSPVELFSCQHLFNCVTGINIRTLLDQMTTLGYGTNL